MYPALKTFGKFARLFLIATWAAAIVWALGSYITRPSDFTASHIASLISSFQSEIWLVYLGMSVLRGFTLLPSTPLVLAGTLLYPDQPWLVLATSMIGIAASSTLIYYCSEALGFSDYFESKKPTTVHRIRRRLEQPAGLIFVGAWAFFPLVPTDAVCYVAGTARMNFAKFLAAVLLGELTLCSIYVFTGGPLLRGLL